MESTQAVLLEESLSYCKHVSGDPVSSTFNTRLPFGLYDLGRSCRHAHTRAAQVKTPLCPRKPLVPLPFKVASGRESFPGRWAPPFSHPPLGLGRQCSVLSLTGTASHLPPPLLSRSPEFALGPPKCALSAVRLGPPLRPAPDI